jgi:opacity protein-like surface antigen
MRLLGAVLLALPVAGTAGAAKPAAPTVSADQPATSWHGELTGGYAPYESELLLPVYE